MAATASRREEKLRRGRTTVAIVEALQGTKLWTTDAPAVKENAEICFALVLVLPGSKEDTLQVRQLEPPPTGSAAEPYTISIDDAYNSNVGVDSNGIPDIGLLPHKNCAAILAFLRERYMHDLIYTTADPLLIAVNPFKDLKNTGRDWMERYQVAAASDVLDPHVFGVARLALERLNSFDTSQTIIVSGESGAGKTEATKQIMAFLAFVKDAGEGNLRIQEAVMAANPVLEAFGNAKTTRNNNSSRFGRFMQLQLGKEGGIRHGFIKNFLLEKVRVTHQGPDERSYHVFYQLLQGASAALRSSVQLLKPEEYAYLRTGGCYTCPGSNDAEDFQVVEHTFEVMQFSREEINTIWSILSGTLLLGNVEIDSIEAAGVLDAAHLSPDAKSILSQCCKLLFLDPVGTERELLFNVKVIGNQTIESPVTVSAARVNRDSLAKAVYERLFDWIVFRLNQTIQPPGGFKKFIDPSLCVHNYEYDGAEVDVYKRAELLLHFMEKRMLDIFGFEIFEHNSLEQLLINITNEQLQNAFIQIVFARETELYRSEGIREAKIEWTDNKEVVEALCGKRDSVLALLEDKSLAPGGTDESIVQGLGKCLAMSDAWKPGRKNPRLNFIICHSIADIQYDATGFIFKNKDLLKPEICAILKASPNPVVTTMFQAVASEKGKLGKGQLIASQFMRSLSALLELISSTESHFIRCLKPHESKQPHDWNNAKVLGQLFSLSILEALQLKNFTFSYRRPYDAFLKQFEQIDYAITCGSSDEREKVKMLMASTGIPQDQWALGKTMVFVKPAGIRELTLRVRELMRAWEPVIQVVEAVYKFNKRMQMIKREIPWAVRIQAHVRKAKAIGRS